MEAIRKTGGHIIKSEKRLQRSSRPDPLSRILDRAQICTVNSGRGSRVNKTRAYEFSPAAVRSELLSVPGHEAVETPFRQGSSTHRLRHPAAAAAAAATAAAAAFTATQ